MSLEAMVWALKNAPVKDPVEQLVLIALADHANTDGTGAFPSQATIAAYAHVSDRTVRNKIRKLEEQGLIRDGDQDLVSHYRADRRPHVYDLNLRAEEYSGRNLTTERAEDDDTTGGISRPNGRNAVSYKPSIEPSIEPSRNHRELRSLSLNAAFEEFWSVYPRKTGKPKALEAFKKVARHVQPETIVAGAIRYRDDPNREDLFTAYPATWLHRDGWDDPPLPTRIDRRRVPVTIHRGWEE